MKGGKSAHHRRLSCPILLENEVHYVIFAVVCIVKHARLVWYALRGKESPEADSVADRDRI